MKLAPDSMIRNYYLKRYRIPVSRLKKINLKNYLWKLFSMKD